MYQDKKNSGVVGWGLELLWETKDPWKHWSKKLGVEYRLRRWGHIPPVFSHLHFYGYI